MEHLRAYIENIIYYNETNYYAVTEVSQGGETLTAVGYLPYISAGETIEADGEYTVHPVYGRQFTVSSFRTSVPETKESAERYLAGGAIKGIGPNLAKRIVKKFKNDTFRIIEEEPERLAEIKGISERMAVAISEQVEAKRGMRDAVIFLQEFGISGNMANRIYDRYGPALYVILEKNPYQLAEDIDGIGFKLADSIARKGGVAADSDYRIRAAVVYVLQQAAANGHTCLPREELVRSTSGLLDIAPEKVEQQLLDMQIESKLTMEGGQGERVYLSVFYYLERNAALMLKGLDLRDTEPGEKTDQRIRRIQKEEGIELDPLQQDAVRAAVNHGLLIITGGPGTGKTTTINTLIRYFEEDHFSILLCAPTGRAAKRMTEATGREAKTIHRLLEYTGIPDKDGGPGDVKGAGVTVPYGGSGNAGGAGSTDGKGRFLRDEKDPLEGDVIIVDEVSMVDIFLMEALLKAIVPGTRLILVGDADQLPSVGPGNVLKDLIRSGVFRCVRLEHIFRQALESDIVVNAHRINRGEEIDLSAKSRDFLFIRGREPERILDYVRVLLTEKLPGYVGASVSELQVLTPTRKGSLGVENLNQELQQFLNPPAKDKAEKKYGRLVLREGDKVMQIRNDYELVWEKRGAFGLPTEKGSGIFNGDTGVVTEIDLMQDTVTVLYDEERYVEYDPKHLPELELAYAVTVHKSQGSEYPAVILPMYPGPHLLMNRNLLYTAVTRAKKCVCIVGRPEVFAEMVRNGAEKRRCTGLADRITELYSDLSLSAPEADVFGEAEQD